MANVLVNDASLQDIADAIREKNGTEETYKPAEMGNAVRAIQSGGAVDESVWVEDDSEIVINITCYQNAAISCLVSKNGTITYKRNKKEGANQYPKWSFSNLAQMSNSDWGSNRILWNASEQAEIINDGYDGEFLITKLDNYAFSQCYNLKRIKNLKDIKSLGMGVFQECHSLKKLDLSHITDTTLNISLFRMSGLEEFAIPPSVESLEEYTFYDCKGLKKIEGMERMKSIGSNCFDGCAFLEGVLTLNASIESLSNYTFRSCAFNSIKFLGTPTGSVGSNAFSECVMIKDIYVPWSEGEVANAPWGAINATIHYNTTYDENHNPIV